MDKLIIEGSPYAGEYDCDDISDFVSSLNMGELHRIKKLTGLRAGEFGEAFDTGDSDLTVGIAAVVLERNGKRVVDDLLWKATAIRVSIGDDGEEDDASPPDGTPSPTPSGGSSGKRTSASRRAKSPSPTGAQD